MIHPLQVTSEEVEELEGRLRGINRMAQIVRAERANVGVEYVLGVGGFDLDRVEGEVGNASSRSCQNAEQWSMRMTTLVVQH